MRILFTITGPWGTGAGTVVDGVAKELIALGHEVRIVFPDAGLPSPERDTYYGNPDLYHIIEFPLEHGGCEFPTFPLIIPDPNPRNVAGAWTYRDLTDVQLAAFLDLLKVRFSSLIDDFKPDVIETEHVWLMGYALRELGYDYVAGAHNSDQMGFTYDERMRPYAVACAQGARFIFAISDAVKKEVQSLYGLEDERVVLMPNGYDQTVFAPRTLSRQEIFRQHAVDADASLPAVTFVGKFSKTKGFDTLLEANALLQKRLPYTLLIFGSGEMSDVYDEPPPPELMTRAHILGHQPQKVIADFHNVASLSVLPSRSEGFGIAALEAMGCGIPVVATETGQLEKIVIGGVVPPEDPAALAASMEMVLTLSEENHRSLCEEARARALEFSWKDIAEKRLAYYEMSRIDQT